VDRFRYKATKAKQAQSRLKALSKLKTISLPKERALKEIRFPDPEELAFKRNPVSRSRRVSFPLGCN